jgi:hypothetical protein
MGLIASGLRVTLFSLARVAGDVWRLAAQQAVGLQQRMAGLQQPSPAVAQDGSPSVSVVTEVSARGQWARSSF